MIEIKKEISNHNDSVVNNHTKSSEKSQTRKVTIMVVVLVGVFLLCNITNFIWWMMKNFITNFNPPGKDIHIRQGFSPKHCLGDYS